MLARAETDVGRWMEEGRKERQSLNVVPVKVRQKQMQVRQIGLELLEQRIAQITHPAPGVQDDYIFGTCDPNLEELVFPPNPRHSARGVGIEPLTPQNFTRMVCLVIK